MRPQYVAARGSSFCGFEAFESHCGAQAKKVVFWPRFSAIFAKGYPQVACISNEGEARGPSWIAVSDMSRSDICRRASRSCWASALQLSYPHARSKRRKKKLSWWTRRRLIPAPSLPVNTSKTIFGRAALPVRFPALGAVSLVRRQLNGDDMGDCIC